MLLLKVFCDTATWSNQLSGGELACWLWTVTRATRKMIGAPLIASFRRANWGRLFGRVAVNCGWQHWVEIPSNSGCCQPCLLQTGRLNRDAFPSKRELGPLSFLCCLRCLVIQPSCVCLSSLKRKRNSTAVSQTLQICHLSAERGGKSFHKSIDTLYRIKKKKLSLCWKCTKQWP